MRGSAGSRQPAAGSRGGAAAGPLSCAVGRTASGEGALADSFDLSELYDEFRDEARGQLARLDAVLQASAAGAALAEDERRALLRALHTLKGNAGMLGFRPLQQAVHEIESLVKQPPAHWPAALLGALYERAALLRAAVDRVGTEAQADAFARLGAAPALPLPTAAPATPPSAPHPPAPPAEPATEPATVRAEDLREDVLRVPFLRLDELLSEIGELGARLAALEAWTTEQRAALEAAGLRRALREQVQSLAATADALRRQGTALRLVPLGRLFARFPALAGELARAQGKPLRVRTEGEATELDKATADALAEPLLHLVRNAVDHGIEPPEQRRRAGKPAQATLTLRAAQEGDRVRIELEDDGGGVDVAAVRARARELGLLSAADEAPSDEEVLELVFRPGFSTRREASELSGRGIGLDAVRGALARLRGEVTLQSWPGQGSRFTLRLPLTVALLPLLFFEAADERLALPSAEVDEIVRAGEPQWVGGAEVVSIRDELLPLARPARLFGWKETREPRFWMLVRHGARAVAVAADRLLEERPATLRALPAALGPARGVAGATVAPDGRVVLLLDPGEIVALNVDLHRGGAADA